MQGPLRAGYYSRLVVLLSTLVVIASLFACGVLPTSRPTKPSPQLLVTTLPTSMPMATATITPIPTATPIALSSSLSMASPVSEAEQAQPSGTASALATPDPGPPPDFQALGDAIVSYLAESGGNAAALVSALEQWGMVPKQLVALAALATQPSVTAADLDGDGQPEVIVAATNPSPDVIFGEGAVLVVSHKNGQYSVAYDSSANGETPGPVAILAITDVNGDGISDLAFGMESCGAHTCMVDVHVLSYRGGAYVNLAEGITIPYPDMIAIQDSNIQGFKNIVIHGNIIGSVGAGPQRASTLTYRLVGDHYELVAIQYDPSNLLYFKVIDAGIALAEGRLDEAVQLYTQAIIDPSLVASGMMMNGMSEVQESGALRSFAGFRLMVAQAKRGDQPAAEAAMAQTVAAGGPFASVAQVFWGTYVQAQAIDPACQAVAAYMQNASELLDILNSFGYANPSFSAEDVCQGMGTGILLPKATPAA